MSLRSTMPVSSDGQGGGDNMYLLKWNHYHSYLTNGLAKLLDDEFSMTDVTLACEGQFIQAHKVALAVCSPFFKEYFKTYRMEKGLIVLANVKFKDLKNLIKFIYHGEVSISNAELKSFLATANDLKIEGLVDSPGNGNASGSFGLNEAKNVTPNPTSATETAISRLSTPSSNTLTTSSSSGPPPMKRSRVSTGIAPSPTTVQTSNHPSTSSSIPKASEPIVNQKLSTAPIVPLPTSQASNYDPLDMEDEQEEEMINLDEVKPEPIAIYTLNDDEDSLDHHEGNSISDTIGGNNSSGIMYHDYQASGPGPSTSSLSQSSHHRMQPVSTSRPASKPPAKKSYANWRTPRVLDGKFFQIVSMDHNAEGVGVRATCVTCQRTIKGRIHPTSNFTTHMKYCHKEMLESYIRYKETPRPGAKSSDTFEESSLSHQFY